MTTDHVDGSRVNRRQALVDFVIAGSYAALFLGVTFVSLAPVPGFSGEVTGLPWLGGGPGLPWFGGDPAGSGWISPRLQLVSYASVGLMLASATGIAFRRIWPRASFLAIAGIAGIQVLLGEPISVWNAVMGASLFSAAAYGSRAFGWLALTLAVLGYVGAWVLVTGLLGRLELLADPAALLGSPLALARAATFAALLAALVVVWAIGDQVRAGRNRLEMERDRALSAARERDANARLDALAERHRIARELHDVVAHGLSVMIIQADGALYAADEHPEAPRHALGVISSTGRESLSEMRRLLGVLRGAGETTATAPQPDLTAIPQLAAGFREAGLEVNLSLPDEVPAVPPGVGLAAYRIVQESLTNVLRHAGPAEAAVVVSAEPRHLLVRVSNGPGERTPASDPGPGLGLMGMRERVRLLGGRVNAGPRPGGGFEVIAELPFVAVESEAASFPDCPLSGQRGYLMPIDVVLVDDQALVRSGFAMLVGSQPDLRVVGEAADGHEAVELLRTVSADVVLMDVRMPGLDGVEATRRIVAAYPDRPRVVVLTTFDLDEYAFAALQAGASGFLLKDALPEELLRAIRTVHAGDAVVAPSTTRRLIGHYVRLLPNAPAASAASGTETGGGSQSSSELAEPLESLTDREREVWLEIVRGLTNGEIATELGISEATVKSHVGSLLAKTGRRDRVALVLLAYERGLVPGG